jgi:lysozyme
MNLITKLIAHEGLIQHAYEDSLGYLTIGVGTLIDKRKGGQLTVPECMYLLDNRINIARASLQSYRWFNNLDVVRQDVCVEMVFNMGLHGLLEFTQMISALINRNYKQASIDFLNSLEARQIGPIRAKDMAGRLANGYYT